MWPYLEESKEEVKLLLRRASIETMPAGVQERADQTDPEEIVRQIQHIDLARHRGTALCNSCISFQQASRIMRKPTVAEGDNPIKCVKDDWRINHLVVVQLAEEFDLRDTSLVELEVVVFETQRDSLEDVVDDTDHEILVVSVQSTNQDGKQMNVAVLDLDWLAEHAFQNTNHLSEQ